MSVMPIVLSVLQLAVNKQLPAAISFASGFNVFHNSGPSGNLAGGACHWSHVLDLPDASGVAACIIRYVGDVDG